MKTPSEYFKKPVIGTIVSKLEATTPEGTPIDFEESHYEVIDIDVVNGVKIYFCNQWNDDKVQMVPGFCVIKFTPNENYQG